MPMLVIDLEQAVRNGTDLSNGDFRGGIYQSCYLERGRFHKSDFRDVDLEGGSLEGADFSGANLQGADLARADLDRVNFRGAILVNAILTDASILETDFTSCIGVVDAGIDPRDYRFIGVWHDVGGWRIKAGCRWFSLEAARDHWGPNGRDNDDALERVEKIAATPAPVLPNTD